MATESEQEQQAERKPTERVVLQQAPVLVIPAGCDPEKVEEAAKLLGLRKGRAKIAVELAWIEVARKVAATKTLAIEAHAGKPGTPDALVGTFRAPSVTSWKGAAVYNAPPLPLVERELVD